MVEYNPNVFVTFGDWKRYKFLTAAPYEVRRRWINLPEGSLIEDIGRAIFNCYVNSLYNKSEIPLVSVFTPTFRPKEKIFRPLQSLLTQTYNNWEWVIVDDSDDRETWSQLVNLSKMDYRIKPFLSSSRSGVIGELKKKACSLCQGDFLVELDHDDELTSQCLEWIVDAFVKNEDAGMVYTDDAEVFEDSGESFRYRDGWGFGYGSYREETYNGKEYSVTNGIPIDNQTIRHIIGVPNHVRAWRKTIYNEIGGHNPNLHVGDDYDLIIRTFLHSKLLHIPKFGYIQYRNRNGNTTFSRNAEIQRIVKVISNHYSDDFDRRFNKRVINE
jgi:glycosyltransferase involved in cell wall biosynthesis